MRYLNFLSRCRRLAIALCLASVSSLTVFAQSARVGGVVTDAAGGTTMPGVNVLEQGTTNGVVTDADGRYSINLSNAENAVLVFSFVGYETQEVPVGGQQVINASMSEAVSEMEEVIVIGYGTAKRKDFTGSVASVEMENSALSTLPNLNVLESLKGNVTGMNIGATNSAGGQPSMIIRGQNSISGTNDPLIILDGVIYMGYLADINPNDIASIDVLKDAVSSAAYGSRAANGVISIVTKKGRSGKPVVTLNASAGIQTWPKRPTVMKGTEWIEYCNARVGNEAGSVNWMQPTSKANYEKGLERVWLDDVLRTGVLQDYQIAVSGAGKNVNYYVSTTYNNNKGVVVGDDFDRISVFGKLDADVTDWLNFGADATYARRDYSGFGADLYAAQTLAPYGQMYRDDKGNLERYPDYQSTVNPLWSAQSGTADDYEVWHHFRLNAYMNLSLPWIEGLSYRLNFTPTYEMGRQGEFYHEGHYIAEGMGIERYSPANLQKLLTNANGWWETDIRYSWVVDNILTYKNTFGKHGIELTAVATRDEYKRDMERLSGSDFSLNGNSQLGMRGLHYATTQKVDEYRDSNGGRRTANIGYLGRVNYSFDNKYYLTASYRRDGASVFGTNRKWGSFAAVGVAWTISNESFMQGISFLNNLKLKVAFGQNGNQGIAPYTTLSRINNGSTGGYRYEFGNTGSTIYYGMVQSTLGNADLGWESTNAWNFGFESAWLNNRLFVDLDAYVSKTYDQIFQRNIPVMSGFKTIYASMGEVDNHGIELNVRTVNIRNHDWTWETNVTFWQNRNKVAHLYGDDMDGDGKEDDDIANSRFIGKSLDAIYGFKQIGIVQEDDAEYIAETGAKPGQPKYANLDSQSGISNEDRTILGYRKENFRLNMGNIVRWKGFELYVLIAGIFGGNGYYMNDNTPAYMSYTNKTYDNMPAKPYWTPENRSNEYPAVSFAGDGGRFLGLQSQGFVRIQDISLSYNFRQAWMEKLNISRLKVFLTMKNVGVFTNWIGGDPETAARYLANTYPVVSTYSLGLNVSF